MKKNIVILKGDEKIYYQSEGPVLSTVFYSEPTLATRNMMKFAVIRVMFHTVVIFLNDYFVILSIIANGQEFLNTIVFLFLLNFLISVIIKHNLDFNFILYLSF